MIESLTQIQSEVPFNNCRLLMEHDGKETPECLGGDCNHAADLLIKSLREKGYDASYLKEEGLAHTGVVCKNEKDEEFLLDPTIPGLPPIRIKDLYPEGKVTEIPRYPIVKGIPSMCRASIRDAIFVSLKFEVAQQAVAKVIKSPSIQFQFNIRQRLENNPFLNVPIRERLPRDHIALTVQSREEENTISLTQNVHTGVLKVINGQRGIIQKRFGTTWLFKNYLASLCEKLGIPQGELLEIFAEAVEIRNRIAKTGE